MTQPPPDPKPPLQFSVELGPELGSLRSLQDLLSSIVEAAGGSAGLLTTWQGGGRGRPRTTASTSSYNLDSETARRLAELVENPSGDWNSGAIARVERTLHDIGAVPGEGPLRVVALPVRSGDRTVGLLCLLHPSNAVDLLSETPGMYNILVDRAEVVVQNAHLLQRLLEERQWLEAIVQHSSQGIVIADCNGKVIGFNVAMERLSGWTLDEAVGHPVHDMFPFRIDSPVESELPSRQKDAHAASASRMSSPEPVEARLRNRHGEWVDVEVTGTAIPDAANALLGWIFTAQDIRERKQRERLQRIFLSGVSHELQTPIAIIKGFSGLMADEEMELSPAQMREKAAIIQQESERLGRMVEQMLEATRLQAGGTKLSIESVALERLVRRTVQKLEPLARTSRCEVRVSAPRRLPRVLVDADRIEQVLTNLIENAFKYSKGQVDISLRAEEREVEVAVTDSGAGVSETDRDRIFQAFERAREGSPLRSVPGVGLGLFICKSIVDAHGGRIGVEKGARGGARFWFTVPRDLSGST